MATPTDAMKRAAARGLELRSRKGGRGGLTTKEASTAGAGGRSIGSGVQRAADIKAGKSLSRETLGKIVGFFSRHAANVGRDAGKPPHRDAGYVAGLLWGGKGAKRWAEAQIRRIDSARKRAK